MTAEAYPGPSEYTITTTGPYEIGHEYTEGSIRLIVRGVEGAFEVADALFAVDPVSGENGNVFLDEEFASNFAGRQLEIQRVTHLEQGWTGQGGAREKGLEQQLDRNTMSVQELRIEALRAVQLSGPVPAKPYTIPAPSAGRTVVGREDGEGWESGPDVSEIANAGTYAQEAAQARDAAERDAGRATSAADAAADHLSAMRRAEGKTFNYLDYIGLQAGGAEQLAFIRDQDTASQDASIVTAGIQAAHDAAMTWVLAGSERRTPVFKAPTGSYALNDEMFSEDFADKLYNNAGAKMYKAVFDYTGASFVAKGWPSHKAVRTSGLWSDLGVTDPVPSVMFRWENKSHRSTGPILRGGKFYGEGEQTDPIALKLYKGNQVSIGPEELSGFHNYGRLTESTFNSAFGETEIIRCGFQPTELGADGFLSSSVRISVTAGAATSAAVTSEDVWSSDHVGLWVYIEDAAGDGMAFAAKVQSVADARNAVLDRPCPVDMAGVHFSFIGVHGSISGASNNILTLRGPTTTVDYVGRYVTVWKGRSAVHSKMDCPSVRVIAQTGNVLTLASGLGAAPADVPILVAPAHSISMSEDTETKTSNNITISADRIESSFFHFGAVMGLFQNCSGVYFIATKHHGNSSGYNNFAANMATLWLDNCASLKFDSSMTEWGDWNPEFGKIMVAGTRCRSAFNSHMLGSYLSGDRAAQFYLDPMGADPDNFSVRLSGEFTVEADNWGHADQDFVRVNGFGAEAMVYTDADIDTKPGIDRTKLPRFRTDTVVLPSGDLQEQLDNLAALTSGVAELTISGGSITVPACRHVKLSSEAAGVADTLDTINGGQEGQIITFSEGSGSGDITYDSDAGNIQLANNADTALTQARDTITLFKIGTVWRQMAQAK